MDINTHSKKHKKDKKNKHKRRHAQVDDDELQGLQSDSDMNQYVQKFEKKTVKELEEELKQMQRNIGVDDHLQQLQKSEFEQVSPVQQKIERDVVEENQGSSISPILRADDKEEIISNVGKIDERGPGSPSMQSDFVIQQINSSVNAAKRSKKDQGDDTAQDDQYNQLLDKLSTDMIQALADDQESNKNRKPAFKRFQILSRIENALRNQKCQESFLDKDGCEILADWLQQLPDYTYPNPKIVLSILGIVERMDISDQENGFKNLERQIKLYNKPRSQELHDGYSECQKLAQNILNKWYRVQHEINTKYDQHGKFDDGWQELQKQLNQEKAAVRRVVNVDAEIKKRGPQQLQQFISQQKRQDNFSKRPEANSDSIGIKKGGSQKWKDVKKTLLNFKKNKKATMFRKGNSSIVKLND